MSSIWRLTYRYRSKFIYLNNVLVLCSLLTIIYLIVHEKNYHSNDEHHRRSTISEMLILNSIPAWVHQFNITHLFDFYWLHTGGYQWHLEQMLDRKYPSAKKQSYNRNLSSILNDLNHHPELGVIVDTAPDPFQPVFSPLPRTSLSLNETCIRLQISDHWYPCYTRPQMMSSSMFKPLITYGLYDVLISGSSPSSSSAKTIHYDEIIYLFDQPLERLNETFFVRQILPRLIRLLALAPQTAVFLSPYFNSKMKYVNQYIDVLIQRGLLSDRKRLIRYNSEKNYHAHAVYSTSSPRSDLILLQHILIGNQSSLRPELILIIRNHFHDTVYNELVQTINQLTLPTNFAHLHIQEYNEKSYSIKQISHLFRRASIVIGMPSHILSHILWCLPGTHIIEIGRKSMTTDYYEISLQLKFHYWLTLTTNKTDQVNQVNFRNVLMKLFTFIDI